MTPIINYLFEANAGLLVLLLFYQIILRGETNFKLLRLFLLSGILVSILFPLVHIGSPQQNSILSFNEVVPGYWLPEVVITDDFSQNRIQQPYSIWKIVAGIYASGVLLSLGRLIAKIISLIVVMRGYNTYTLKKLRITESTANKPTFSFFNFIYIGNADTLTGYEKERIIQHESVHARQLHSLDILLLNLVGAFFWFNPFIKTYKKIFVQLHEFEADARAVENADADKYCNLLARVALQSADFKLANHFNNSLTLKRIAMIRSIKNKMHQWKLAALVIYVPAMFFLLACQEQIFAQNEKPKVEMSSSDQVYMVVEKMPEYNGGSDALIDFLRSEMRYPKNARRSNIQGTTYAEFIVEKTGVLSEIKILRGFDPECDAEALRVVKLMENWNPGQQNGKIVRTKMVLPINFKLN